MRNESKFWNRIARRYAKKPVPDAAAYAKKLALTQHYLKPDQQIFEFGCGTGSTALEHAAKVSHVLATDISPEMIKIAQEKAQAQGITNAEFAVATLADTARGPAQFDVVLGLSILHLLADREAAIREVYGLLKPGGIFVSNTACINDHMRWFKPIAWLGHAFGLLPLVKFFTSIELRQSLEQAGFVIEEVLHPSQNSAYFAIARKPA